MKPFIINSPISSILNDQVRNEDSYLTQDGSRFHFNSVMFRFNNQKYDEAKRAFNNVYSIMKSECITIFGELVSVKFKNCSIDYPDSKSVLDVLLQSIPVYITRSTEKDTLPSIHQRFNPVTGGDFTPELSHDYPADECIDYFKNFDIKEYDGTNFDIDPSKEEPLGLYVKETTVSTLEDICKYRRIFLWADRIYANANRYNLEFEELFFFTLCHEFAHALMDVYSETCRNNGQNDTKAYYQLREESLANGLAIYLYKQSDYSNNIMDFVNSQSFPYRLGSCFQYKALLKKEVHEWMEMKSRNLPQGGALLKDTLLALKKVGMLH